MSTKKDQHVIPHPDGGWQVKGSGNSRATKKVQTQKDGIKIARNIAKNQGSKVIVHRSDGSIQEEGIVQPDIKNQIRIDLKEAFEDIKLYEQEKKKLKTAKELLNEL